MKVGEGGGGMDIGFPSGWRNDFQPAAPAPGGGEGGDDDYRERF